MISSGTLEDDIVNEMVLEVEGNLEKYSSKQIYN